MSIYSYKLVKQINKLGGDKPLLLGEFQIIIERELGKLKITIRVPLLQDP